MTRIAAPPPSPPDSPPPLRRSPALPYPPPLRRSPAPPTPPQLQHRRRRHSPPRSLPLAPATSPSSSSPKAKPLTKRPRSPAEWAPLPSHPAFSRKRAAAAVSGGRGLAAWDAASLRLYVWDSASRGVHRISVRLRDGIAGDVAGSEGEVAVEAAIPSEMLMPEDHISYEVSHISLNMDGSSLLLAGSHCINTMYVHKRISEDGDTISCRTVPVASQILPSANAGIKVLQASWHPFSSSHLGILTSDAVFRLFDLSSDLEQPEQELYLQPVLPGICQNASSICPVAFSYGSDHLWDRFSVFILFSEGSIYVLCPVVPFGSDCSRRHIRAIYEDVNAFGLQSSNANIVTNSHVAIAWLEATFPDLINASTESSTVLISRARPYAPIDGSLSLQGPLCRVCENNSESEDKNSSCEGKAVGFLYNSVGKDSVLVTVWSSGQLQIDALADEIQPHWNVGIPPRLNVDSHGHLKSVAMICESNRQDPSVLESRGTGANVKNNPDAVWMGHSPPLLRLAIVDLALPKASGGSCLSLFPDPLVPERFYCAHGGGIDMVTLHFLPFSCPEMTSRPPSVHPVLMTGNSETSFPFLAGFVTIADAYGHLQLVGITFSYECIVLEMKGWKDPLPLQYEIDSESDKDVESTTPQIISKELLAGPKVVVLPSSSSLQSLTTDSAEGRTVLHHYIRIFHENYVEYAHKVFIELKEHANYLKAEMENKQKRLNAVKQTLLNVEAKAESINDRIDRAGKVYTLLEKRLESFKMLPAANKKPLSRAEQEFKEQLGRFADVELDALHSSIDALSARAKRHAQPFAGGSAMHSSTPPWRTPGSGRRSHVSGSHMELLKSSLERLTLINEENNMKLRLIDHQLRSQEE